MKRTLVAAIVAAALSAFPAHAGFKTVQTKAVRFKAVTPCFTACSYYVSPHDPATAATAIAFEEDFHKQQSYACTNPGPAGSWRDLVLTAPKGATHLKVEATPDVDWDLVLCGKPHHGNNGKLLAWEKQERSPSLDEEDPCVVGCKDTLLIKVKAGTKYVLRAYSWIDPNDLVARYWFMKI